MSSKQPEPFHEYLSSVRASRGLNVREAARAIGISHSRLLDFEQGFDQHTRRPCTPALSTLFKIAAAYGLDPAEVLARAGFKLPGVPTSEDERALLAAYRELDQPKRKRLLAFVEELRAGGTP